MAGAAEPRQFFQPIKYHLQPSFQQRPFDLNKSQCTPAVLVECKERDRGRVMLGAVFEAVSITANTESQRVG
jgi:hypothetical protein